MSTTDPRQTNLSPIIPLTCSSWRGFAERYVDDLAHGALCLAHPEPLPLLSTVTVQLSLPDSVDITLPARVVQVITGPHAAQLGSEHALALELEVEGETKRQLTQLVEFARTQRAGDSEEMSFARAMLEQTPSLPPREVGMRLSQLPAALANGGPKRGTGSSGSSSAAVSMAPKNPQPQPGSPLLNGTTPATSQAPAASQSAQSGYRHAATAPKLRATSDVTRPLSPARLSLAIRGNAGESETHAEPASESSEASAPDPAKLKDLLSSVARKQYDNALRITNELLEANPKDRQTQRWRALCYARIALTRNDQALAAQAYQAMLELDPSDREAREFLKAHERSKKLESLPFGRFFNKKK